MKQVIQNNKNLIEFAFIYFILLQPILDLFAYLELPLSEIIRVLAMGLGLLYVTFHTSKKVRKYTGIYHIVIFVYFAIHFLINYFAKNPLNISLEITHMVKTFFFVEMLMVYLCVIVSFSRRSDWQKIILQNVFISMVLISVIMILADLTDSGRRTYGMLAKAGHTGWFFSGNELSAILVIGFGMTLLLLLRKNGLLPKLFIVLIMITLIWSMMTIGTKVSFGGLFLFLISGILITLLDYFREKKYAVDLYFLIPLLIITTLWIPYSAIGQNLDLTFANQQTNNEDLHGEILDQDMDGVGNVLSGRNDFMNVTITQYEDAPITQQLFGMGYGGNYQTEPKLIEMDLFDWFFGFGIVGFILLLTPISWLIYHIVKNIVQSKFRYIDTTTFLVGLSVCLGFGVSFVAGHVLSSPAASLYVALMVAYLYVLSDRFQTEGKVTLSGY